MKNKRLNLKEKAWRRLNHAILDKKLDEEKEEWSNAKVAKKVGMNVRTFDRILTNETKSCTWGQLEKLSALLGIPCSQLSDEYPHQSYTDDELKAFVVENTAKQLRGGVLPCNVDFHSIAHDAGVDYIDIIELFESELGILDATAERVFALSKQTIPAKFRERVKNSKEVLEQMEDLLSEYTHYITKHRYIIPLMAELKRNGIGVSKYLYGNEDHLTFLGFLDDLGDMVFASTLDSVFGEGRGVGGASADLRIRETVFTCSLIGPVLAMILFYNYDFGNLIEPNNFVKAQRFYLHGWFPWSEVDDVLEAIEAKTQGMETEARRQLLEEVVTKLQRLHSYPSV